RLIVNCSRQWGKSTVTAAKALHMALTRLDSLILCASPTARQSVLFIQKARKFARVLGTRERRDPDHPISALLPNESRIIGLPGASEDHICGFSSVDLLVIDEAARVRDEVFYAILPVIAA